MIKWTIIVKVDKIIHYFPSKSTICATTTEVTHNKARAYGCIIIIIIFISKYCSRHSAPLNHSIGSPNIYTVSMQTRQFHAVGHNIYIIINWSFPPLSHPQ